MTVIKLNHLLFALFLLSSRKDIVKSIVFANHLVFIHIVGYCCVTWELEEGDWEVGMIVLIKEDDFPPSLLSNYKH